MDDDEESDLYSVPSKLRSRAAAQHPEEDTKYSGKRVSRRSLSQDHPSSDEGTSMKLVYSTSNLEIILLV